MRIFTLGRNGIPLFLFALILFSGTFTSYGQCPVVTDLDSDADGAQQFFCDSGSFLVQDLQATGADVVWYAEGDLENPLDNTTVLTNGEVYFAEDLGATTECATLPSVTVIIYEAPEILGIKEATRQQSTKQSLPILTFCVEDVTDSGLTLADIRTNADSNGVQWFTSSTGGTSLLADTELVDNTVYWVQQTTPSGCETTRTSVTVNLVSEAAPTGDAEQTFCIIDNPTLGDIVASGNNRYYTSATGAVQLSEATELEVGTDIYYVSSVGDICESTERLAVTVTVTDVTFTPTEQSLCRNQSEGNNLGLATVAHLSPAGGTWYADQNFTQLLPAETLLTDNTTYYLAPENCASTSVLVTLTDTPNAGQTSTAFFCENEGSNSNLSDLYDQITNPVHLEEAGIEVDRGTINHPAFTGLLFDPAVLGVGTHVLTHTVAAPEGSLCESDSAQITVVVYEAPEAGNDVNETICASDLGNTTALIQRFASYIEGRDQGGSFDIVDDSGVVEEYTPFQLYQAFSEQIATNPIGTFSVVYNVSNENECTDSAQVNLTVQAELFAGNDATIQLLEDVENEETLEEALASENQNPTPAPGGTWTNADGATVAGSTAPTTPGVYTYTVSQQGFCSDTATVTVLDIPQDCPVVTDTAQGFCASIGDDSNFGKPTVADLEPENAVWYASLESQDALPADTVLEDGVTYFAGDADGECVDRSSVTVTIFDTPNAGKTTQLTYCTNEAPVNLVEQMEESILGAPQTTGTFTLSGSEVLPDHIFDPAAFGPGSYTFTYTVQGNEDCPTDTATVTVTVDEAPEAGVSNTIELVDGSTEVIDLFAALGETAQEGGSWDNGNGSFDPATDTPGIFTYTVTNDNCSDSATVTIITENVEEPTCPEVTEAEQAFCESIGDDDDFHLPNVSDLLPTGATWYASADATEALPVTTLLENGGVYFAGNADGTCDARQSVTVTIDDSPNAGGTSQAFVCENSGPIDLLDEMEESILGPADLGGTFTPALASGGTIFDPAVDAPGRYTYRVESTNDACDADTAVIDVTITPAETAGTNDTFNFCANQEPQSLFDQLAEGVSTNGTFEGFEDGMFDPAVDAPGEYTYTVEQAGDCEGTSTVIITINVSEAPAAPTVTDQSFCISEGATVADLSDENGLLWYTDEALSTLADEADLLVEGTYYVTVTNEGECQSEATPVAVTLTDAAAPTLAQGGNIFCEFDDPTIAELAENVTATGTITWYDAATGGNVVSSSELLEDGVTYYAASTDATSACESSVRLSVTVDLSECPVVIPEAFSPNDDGINDRFEITHIAEEFPNYTIEIYNRWGNIVFKGNAATPNWDGISTESRSLGDSVLPVGVYFYIVNFNDGQTAPTQGRLYLSR